jgi:hypothetical protein
MTLREHLEHDGPRTVMDGTSTVARDRAYRSIARLLKPGARYHDLLGSVYLPKQRRAPAPPIDHGAAVPEIVAVVKEQVTNVEAMASVVLPAEPTAPEIVEVEPAASGDAGVFDEPAIEEVAQEAASGETIICQSPRASCHYGGCKEAGRCLGKPETQADIVAQIKARPTVTPQSAPGDGTAKREPEPGAAPANDEDDHDASQIDPETRKHMADIKENLAASQAMLAAAPQSAEPAAGDGNADRKPEGKSAKLTKKAVALAENIDYMIRTGKIGPNKSPIWKVGSTRSSRVPRATTFCTTTARSTTTR